MVPSQDAQAFSSYLMSGERILWTGRPKQGLVLTGRDAFLVPFSLLWGGFAIFWNVSVWNFPDTGDSTGWFMRLWGLPFLAAGLYFIIGRFLHDAMIRKSLRYAVTDQRVLILRSRSAKLKSLDIQRLPKLELSEQAYATGTIEFDGDSSLFSYGRMHSFGWWTPSLSGTTQFFRIADPRRVYELVRAQSRQV